MMPATSKNTDTTKATSTSRRTESRRPPNVPNTSNPQRRARGDDPPEAMLATPISPDSMNTAANLNVLPTYVPDLQAVNELLGTMKLTLGTLGATFDILGDQTVKIAELGPAIDATHQIHIIHKQLDEQHQRQEVRMQDVKNYISDELKLGVRDHLQREVNNIVQEIVRREIAERVRHQLDVQIPRKLREDVREYKQHILAVKTRLHNSEARRHNALISSSGLDEPLKPLVPESLQSTGSGTAGNATSQRDEASEMKILPPSPLFPRSVTSLLKLGSDSLRELLHAYGLPQATSLPGLSQAPDTRGRVAVDVTGDSRGQNLNTFLSHIGVNLHLIPSSPLQGNLSQPQSPLIMRASHGNIS